MSATLSRIIIGKENLPVTPRRSRLTFGLLTTLALTPPALVQAQSIEDLYQQGRATENAGDYAQAEAIWRQILQLDPNDTMAHFNLGVALGEQNALKKRKPPF